MNNLILVDCEMIRALLALQFNGWAGENFSTVHKTEAKEGEKVFSEIVM